MEGKGFTLIELITVVAISAIIAVFAVPAWQHLTARMRMTAQINTLLGEILYARSEAIERGRRVVLCQSTDQQHCADGQVWDQGWLAFVDVYTSGTIQRDPGDPIVFHHVRHGQATTLTANRRYFRLEPDGSSTNGTFKLCPSQEEIKPRALILSRVGRARVSSLAPSGDKLTCP